MAAFDELRLRPNTNHVNINRVEKCWKMSSDIQRVDFQRIKVDKKESPASWEKLRGVTGEKGLRTEPVLLDIAHCLHKATSFKSRAHGKTRTGSAVALVMSKERDTIRLNGSLAAKAGEVPRSTGSP